MKDLKKYYKYESKWIKGVFLPLLSSDNLKQLKKYKYNIKNTTEWEWKQLQFITL
jgi:hypothetical protein